MAQFHVGQEGAALVSMEDAIKLQPLSPFPHQWKAAICALQRNDDLAFAHFERFRALVPGHTLESLQVTERSSNPQFLHERRRFYDGLECRRLDFGGMSGKRRDRIASAGLIRNSARSFRRLRPNSGTESEHQLRSTDS